MTLGSILFSLFTVLACSGCWIISRHFRGVRFATIATMVLAAFFVGLAVGVWHLLADLGPLP